MDRFEFEQLWLKGAWEIKFFSMDDNRGSFMKCFEKNAYLQAGIRFQLNETFVSVSAKNVIRGLHFQIHNPQTKLVCALKGRVWDVIVDLREDSPTLKKWVGVELSAKKHNALYIPKGFAHGFVSLEDGTTMLYQCSGVYDKDTDTGIRFDDSDIGIEWPVDLKYAVHSARDMQLMSFVEYMEHPMECKFLDSI